MDLGVNFMDNLLLLFTSDREAGFGTPDSPAWLEHAFEGTHSRLTTKNTAGSLSPGRVGGPNATSGFSQYLSINPWDFILMIEGAVTFKPSLTRKLESSGHARLSYPFTVEPSSIGAGAISSNDERKARAGSSEVWMPLWPKPANFTEVVTLLREGNIRVGAKAPRDGLDMARCIAKLGMDRGIHGFQRYLFLKRSGDNDLAIPLTRFDVSRTCTVSADLISDLDHGGFLQRLCGFARKQKASGGFIASQALRSQIHQLENTLFALTRTGGGQPAVHCALILLGEAMQALAVSRKGQQAVAVLPRLSEAWVMIADDSSAEFRIALALASLADMRAYVTPVAWNDKNKRWEWQPDSRLCVWGKGDLTRNLVRIVGRRVIEAQRQARRGEPFASYSRVGARLADIQTFLSGQTDNGRVAELFAGLIWADLPDTLTSAPEEGEGFNSPLPTVYSVLKPFFTQSALLKRLGRLPEDARLALPGELSRLLAAGQIQKAQDIAWRRARIAGLGWPKGGAPQSAASNGPRLLAALAIPLEPAAIVNLLPRAKKLQPESA
jgi:CRISPR-associated protein Csx17